MTQLVPLAAEGFDKNKVTPGILGFIVFAALALGVWALMKSMNRHMGKVSFEEAPDPDAKASEGAEGDARPKAAASAASETPAKPSGASGASAKGSGGSGSSGKKK
ncbi:hypothetical protein ACH4SP_22535 [Streptomyces sp. NPDC021093]|uniref:hypothetical protein n=1 Tax=Streptomyces sp. NPDC021093 TaxID=3365112 RepID=UPI0037A6CED4